MVVAHGPCAVVGSPTHDHRHDHGTRSLVTEAEDTIVFEAYRQPQFGASGQLLITTTFANPDAAMFPIGETVADAQLDADVTLPLAVDVNNQVVLAMADGVRRVRFEVKVVNDTQYVVGSPVLCAATA